MFFPVYILIVHSTGQRLLQLYPVNGEQRSQSSFRNLSENWSVSADRKGFDGGNHIQHSDALTVAEAFSWIIDTYVFVYTVSRGTTEAHWKPAHGRSVQQQNRGPS